MHRTGAPTGNPEQFNNVLPFKQLDGGIAKSVNDFVLGIQNAYAQLAALSGIDRYSQNNYSAPADTPATLIKAAIASTQDSLKPIYSGWVDIMERMARNIAMKVQQLCIENDDETFGYYPVIGQKKMTAIKIAGDTPPAEYGIIIEALPSAAERQSIIDAAQAATNAGRNGTPILTYSEYLFVVSRLNVGAPLNDVRAYIAFKEARAEKLKQQNAQMMMKSDEEKSINVENNKTKNEKERYQFQTDEDIRKEYWKAMFKTASEKEINADQAFSEFQKFAVELGFNAAQMNAQNKNNQPVIPDVKQQQQPEAQMQNM